MAVQRILPAVIAVATLTLAACAGVAPNRATAPVPAPRGPDAKHARIDPDLPPMPAASSGRGGYYQDDGPGDNPPPNLKDTPDAQVKPEPYSKRGNRPYVVFGKTYTPIVGEEPFMQRGVSSWYGKKFHGQRTSSGELYDMYKMTAAHPTLPIPSYARVSSVVNGKQVIVRINDRGPFHSSRIIDVSYTAALKLGLLGAGSHEVQVERLLAGDIEKIAAERRNAPHPLAEQPPQEIAALMLQDRVPLASDAAVAQPATSAAMPAAPGFYLQLGAFNQPEKAGQMRAQLAQYGGALEGTAVTEAGGVHRLFCGPFESRALAIDAARTLPAALGLKPIVIRR